MSSPTRVGEPVLGLSMPPVGLRAGEVVQRFPSVDDVDATLEKTLFSLLPGE